MALPCFLHHGCARYPFGKVCPTSTAGLRTISWTAKSRPSVPDLNGPTFCPQSPAQSGMHFPQSTSTGNYVPFQRQIPGRIFRKPAHPESPSHFGRIRARNHRPIRPPINKEASSRTAGHEVHREFRTQRRPLNVAFFLRRTVEQGTSCPDAREEVSFRKMDRPPSAMGATPPARPFWRLQPCCPDLPWWGDPLRLPSCRAAS